MQQLPLCEKMSPSAKKYRDCYDMKPDAPVIMREFGYAALDEWIKQGYIKNHDELSQMCGYDEGGRFGLGGLGWCEAEFYPRFEERVIEDRGEHEVAVDHAGRTILFFKGRRNGFMPEYIDHPVKDMYTLEKDILPRLDPKTPKRYSDCDVKIKTALEKEKQGEIISQWIVGAYMYLRSLIGPLDLLYMFYDKPGVIHACMKAWFELCDAVTAHHQKFITFDEIYFGEDICYNHGCLISPEMFDEFLRPYYEQLLYNFRSRQLDKTRVLHMQIDTDGFCDPVIPLYRKLGADMFSPFEIAANCDVLRTADEYPDLRMFGGMDKRVLAATKDDIDRMVDRVLPFMRRRGGFIPTCDHGVPAEVSFENFLHFRKRLLEYSK